MTGTTPFGRDERERDPLLRRLAALPAAVEPSRELWPAIRAGLEAPREPVARSVTLRWPYAAAAGLAIASVSALLTFGLVRQVPVHTPASVATATPVAELQPVAYGTHGRIGPEYLETRAELFKAFQARLQELAPDTRAQVEQNLAVIQQAARDIDAALAEDPSSRLLNRLLLSTYQEEIALYNDVARVGPRAPVRT